MERMDSEPVASPCIGVCTMDDDERYCLGCHRTTNEIARWLVMTEDEKRRVLEQLAERMPIIK